MNEFMYHVKPHLLYAAMMVMAIFGLALLVEGFLLKLIVGALTTFVFYMLPMAAVRNAEPFQMGVHVAYIFNSSSDRKPMIGIVIPMTHPSFKYEGVAASDVTLMTFRILLRWGSLWACANHPIYRVMIMDFNKLENSVYTVEVEDGKRSPLQCINVIRKLLEEK